MVNGGLMEPCMIRKSGHRFSDKIMHHQNAGAAIDQFWAIAVLAAERKRRRKMTQQAAVRHKRGGLYFEDFIPGETVEHRYTRTVTQMDHMLFSNMTLGPTIANLGMTDVKFPHPLFENDTVHCTTEVIGKRESKSRPGAGIVEFHHRAYNQDNKLVAECRRQAFILMQPKS